MATPAGWASAKTTARSPATRAGSCPTCPASRPGSSRRAAGGRSPPRPAMRVATRSMTAGSTPDRRAFDRSVADLPVLFLGGQVGDQLGQGQALELADALAS